MSGSPPRGGYPPTCSTLQSFPEEFKLVGSESAQYKALGNAIPPVMFWYVANELIKQIKYILNENIEFKKYKIEKKTYSQTLDILLA